MATSIGAATTVAAAALINGHIRRSCLSDSVLSHGSLSHAGGTVSIGARRRLSALPSRLLPSTRPI